MGTALGRRQPRAGKDIAVRALHVLGLRLRSLLFRNRQEVELAEELRLHIERLAEQWIGEGVEPADARARAMRQFGAIESLKDDGQIFSCDISPQGKARKIFTLREPLQLHP